MSYSHFNDFAKVPFYPVHTYVHTYAHKEVKSAQLLRSPISWCRLDSFSSKLNSQEEIQTLWPRVELFWDLFHTRRDSSKCIYGQHNPYCLIRVLYLEHWQHQSFEYCWNGNISLDRLRLRLRCIDIPLDRSSWSVRRAAPIMGSDSGNINITKFERS